MRKPQALIFGLALLAVSWSSARAALIEYRFNPSTQHIYARTDVATPWAAAEADAVAAGAHLVTINDVATNNWVQSSYPGNNWIGLYDVADTTGQPDPPGDWRWSSGSPVAYTNWGAGEPNGAAEDHAAIRGDRMWNDLNGTTNSTRGIVEFAATLEVQQHHYNPATGKVYLKTNSTTWENAELLAGALGGHLATVRNAAENEYVAAATRGGWIGTTDRSDEGNFTWASGDPSTYTNWNSGEPNGGTGENYGMMYNTGRWNDAGAAATGQGIIELSGTHPVVQYKYNPATGHVYARTANAANWQTAQLVARATGGDLVSLNDDAENTWVQSNYGGNNWIGLYDVADQTGLPDPPGDWRWSNGDAVGYTNWAGPVEPNGASEDHATLRGDQLWNDWSGNNSAQAIVEFPDAVPGTTLSGTRFNPATNKIYALTPSAAWRAAELIARVNNAHLATVNDDAENQWLAANMTGGSSRWIGMTDEGHDGGWLWASGEGGRF